MNVCIGKLKKALHSLDEAVSLYHTKGDDPKIQCALRDAVIQRFEYTYELAWKLLRRWLEKNISPESAQPVFSRKEMYRLAAKEGLIEEPSQWFAYHEARNQSLHIDDEDTAKQVFEIAVDFAKDCHAFLSMIEKIND